MNSPHWQITEQLKASVETWAAANWAAATVVSGFFVERFYEIIEGNDTDVLIALIPTEVADAIDGQAVSNDEDLITVSILILQRLPSVANTDLVATDAKANQLRRHIKQVVLSPITINENNDEEIPDRRSVQYTTIFDRTALRREIFAAAIIAEYSVSTGDL